MESKRASTLNFFFTALLRAFEFSGEQIIHDEGGDVSGNLQVLLRVVGFDEEIKLVAAFDEAREEFVNAGVIVSMARPLLPSRACALWKAKGAARSWRPHQMSMRMPSAHPQPSL